MIHPKIRLTLNGNYIGYIQTKTNRYEKNQKKKRQKHGDRRQKNQQNKNSPKYIRLGKS